MDKKHLRNIAATLKYGWFDGSHYKLNWVLYALISFMFVGGGVACILVISLDFDIAHNLFEYILVVIGCLIGFLSVPTLLLVILLKNTQHMKRILLWMEDAVELSAFSRKVGETRTSFNPQIYKIQVEFTYNGKLLHQESTCKPIGGGTEIGYHRIWKDYLDKKIDILYSPKYEQVMVLKHGL